MSVERVLQAVAATGLGIWDVHIPSGKAIYNEQWLAMLGYSENEILPDMAFWQSLIHPDDVAQVNHAVGMHLDGITVLYQSEHRLRHQSGHWVWVYARGKIIERDANGQPLRIIGTQQDISEQAREQLALADQLRQISELVARQRSSTQSLINAIPVSNNTSSVPLTPRQKTILTLVAQGKTSANIAQILNIAHTTVLAHRRCIADKINAKNTADWVRYAIRNGLVER